MAKLVIGSLNVRGLNNKIKRKRLFHQIRLNKYDIFLIQETFCTGENERLWRTEWGGKAHFANGVNNARGYLH